MPGAKRKKEKLSVDKSKTWGLICRNCQKRLLKKNGLGGLLEGWSWGESGKARGRIPTENRFVKNAKPGIKAGVIKGEGG